MFYKKCKPLAVGTDIIEIKRIKQTVYRYKNRFLNRIFTRKEQAYCQKFAQTAPHYAARFAAKEAVIKTLSEGFKTQFSWKDIEILNNSVGKPELFFSPRLKALFPKNQVILSMSHCRNYAIATAILI